MKSGVFNHSVHFIAWPFGVAKSYTPLKECLRYRDIYDIFILFYMNHSPGLERLTLEVAVSCILFRAGRIEPDELHMHISMSILCIHNVYTSSPCARLHKAPLLYLSRKLLATAVQASMREHQGEGFEL